MVADPDASFDEFADLDDKLEDFFGASDEDNSNLRQMTQQFFKGTGDMKDWDKVDEKLHEAADDDHQDQVDAECDDLFNSFFSDDDDDEKEPENKELDFAPQHKTIAIFGGSGGGDDKKPPPPPPVQKTADKFNVFLKKIINPKHQEKAAQIIVEISDMSEEDAKKLVKKPIIKVLIGVPKEEADAAHAKFDEADLVSTVKKCL